MLGSPHVDHRSHRGVIKMKTGSISLVTALMFSAFVTGGSYAQVASKPTIWSFMGIPQAGQKIHGALINRRGNHPGLERKPAMKAIADPANLESPVPAIKKAAEVKTAEDLKPQKIKAVKYLAKIGCGCYDIDGSITAAMLASSEDCTEDVRLATVEAIAEQAGGKCCANCGQVCCCNEAVIKRLAQMAYHRDDKGCYIEPSQRVREAAARALDICCPNRAPVIEVSDQPEVQPEPLIVPEGIEPSAPEGIDGEAAEGEAYLPPIVDSFTRQAPEHLAPVASPHGVIIHLDAERRAAHVHFEDRQTRIPVGSLVVVYTETPQGREVVGRMRVYDSFEGSANIQELDPGTFDKVVRGTRVMTDPSLVALGNVRF